MVQLLILLLVLVLVVFPLWALLRILALGRQHDAIAEQLATLQRELESLRRAAPQRNPPTTPVATQASPLTAEPPREPTAIAPPSTLTGAPVTAPLLSSRSETTPTAVPRGEATPPGLPSAPPPPPSPTEPPPPVAPVFAREAEAAEMSAAEATAPALGGEPPPTFVPRPTSRVIDWEQFMGAKLFAWLGGLAAFLGAAFFVKYSFEHDHIPPEVRVALGYLFGIALVIGGLKIPRARYAVTAQTLIATGIVTLYGVTFACHAFYHFALFAEHPVVLFGLMVLITVTAFLLAVRLEAQVVAVLGILGGFLTPVLLSTGQNNPVGLFSYVALLDVGLIAVALHRRWHYLVPLGAAGSIVLLGGWAEKFLRADNSSTAMIVIVGGTVLFVAAHFVARRRQSSSTWLLGSTFVFPAVAFIAGLIFLGYPGVAARPGLLFTFVFVVDAAVLVLAWYEEAAARAHLFAGAATFILLGAWTATALTSPLLPWALAFYLVFAALHGAFPLVLERHRPAATAGGWGQFFPPLTLLLMLAPLFKLDALTILFWPAILLIDLIAIGLALVTGSLLGVALVLLLTLGVTGVWIFQVPATAASTPAALLVIGGFAVLFFATGLYLARRWNNRRDGQLTGPWRGDPRSHISAFSTLLPFVLLVMMTQRLPLPNPSPIFGLALLLTVLTLGLSLILTVPWLSACALAGVAALEYTWRQRYGNSADAAVPLLWFVGFYGVFTSFPFLFRRRLSALTGPWAVAALAGVAQFPLVYHLVQRAYPNDRLGLLAAAFAVPPLLGLVLRLRDESAEPSARLNQLAWFGGIALLFITAIFPIQFERQWLTVSWAAEGVALLWLFHRVPHAGLRATGVALLVITFARLALNPAVLAYHARQSTPLFNWFLYSYGAVIVALFGGARLLAPPRERTLGVNAPPLLNTLATILTFLLVNIEIADFFSPPGARALTFNFSGNFARDMTYTIAWALFALALLLVSFWKKLRAGRFAALALLGIALLKLFFHDLARLEALYRIGALFAVALIAIIASFAYQRFLPAHDKPAAENP